MQTTERESLLVVGVLVELASVWVSFLPQRLDDGLSLVVCGLPRSGLGGSRQGTLLQEICVACV